MNKLRMMLWGREFNFDITYDCYSNEKILKAQEVAIRDFFPSQLKRLILR